MNFKKKYRFTLRNQNPKLDLRAEQEKIKNVINYIGRGGDTGQKFRPVKQIELSDIKHNSFELETVVDDEKYVEWRRQVGRLLANNYGMREFCDPDDQKKMFDIEEIENIGVEGKSEPRIHNASDIRYDIPAYDYILHLLQKKKQIILYGPPGTGKTYNTKNIAIRLLGDEKTYEEFRQEGRIEFITFHPSYSYEEFIEGITVATEGEDIPTESLQYVCKSGIFKNMCKRALGKAIDPSDEKLDEKKWIDVLNEYETLEDDIDFSDAPEHVLIIDEINRGDIAKILGELITLLEADKRLSEDNELIAKLPASGDRFCVPPNLYIIATMNTADRSLALLDVALRRRFGFIEMNPDLDLIEEYINENSEDIEEDARRLLTKSIDAVRKINIEISKDKAIGRDKQIGHSFLFKVHTIDDLILAWRHEILPLLEEYCYSDYLKINQIVFGRDTDWISQTDGIKEINRMNIGQMLDEIIKE